AATPLSYPALNEENHAWTRNLERRDLRCPATHILLRFAIIIGPTCGLSTASLIPEARELCYAAHESLWPSKAIVVIHPIVRIAEAYMGAVLQAALIPASDTCQRRRVRRR